MYTAAHLFSLFFEVRASYVVRNLGSDLGIPAAKSNSIKLMILRVYNGVEFEDRCNKKLRP